MLSCFNLTYVNLVEINKDQGENCMKDLASLVKLHGYEGLLSPSIYFRLCWQY